MTYTPMPEVDIITIKEAWLRMTDGYLPSKYRPVIEEWDDAPNARQLWSLYKELTVSEDRAEFSGYLQSLSMLITSACLQEQVAWSELEAEMPLVAPPKPEPVVQEVKELEHLSPAEASQMVSSVFDLGRQAGANATQVVYKKKRKIYSEPL